MSLVGYALAGLILFLLLPALPFLAVVWVALKLRGDASGVPPALEPDEPGASPPETS